MKKIFALLITLALLAPIGAYAQGGAGFDYKTRQAVASDFNSWMVFSSTTVAAGAATITIEDQRVTVLGSTAINPFRVNSKVLVDTGSVAETVTITAASCTSQTPGQCTITATFGNAHAGRYQITSGSFGAQEALDFLTSNGTVIIQPLFAGATSVITSLVRGSTSLAVEDWRSGNVVYYGWTGSAYATVFSITATNASSSAAAQVAGIPTNVFMSAAVTSGASNVALTGLTWTIPANTAINYPFHCEVTFNQATAATANAFTITTATQAPTNGTLWGYSTTAATTATRAVVKAYNATTATTIISVTPTATGTDEVVFLDGFIEQPTNAAAAVVTIGLTTTSGATDVTTVARDGFCRLF
jgi:hypothetical protein